MAFRSVLLAIAAPLLSGVYGAGAQPADCPPTELPVEMGTPVEPGLDEISGLAASRQAPGMLWAINDSGAPVVYALTESGMALGRYALAGASLVDWEDIAVGPGPVAGADYLYVADVGNNNLTRSVVPVYRVLAPVVDPGQAFVDTVLADAEVFHLAYPARTHDCEALIVTPDTGSLYLLTKDSTGVDGGYSIVYRNAAPLEDGATIPLTEEASVYFGTNFLDVVTAADLSPDGRGLLVRTYTDVYYWPLAPGQPVSEAVAGIPCMLPGAVEMQSESIAFATAASGYYTVSEWFRGEPQPIFFYSQAPWEPEADPDCRNTTGGLYEVGDRLCLRIPDALSPQGPYQWHRDGAVLVSDGRSAGVQARSLVILPLTVEDSGAYTCTYETGSKEIAVFGPAQVLVVETLPASGVFALCLLALVLAVMGVAAVRGSSFPGLTLRGGAAAK
ncbi:MAG: hypothetical protein ACLFTT_09435 [Candidatus Hydrogenedentota bacterium]